MLINPDQVPLVAVEEMNRTHLDEANLLNELYGLILNKKRGDPVDDQLSAVLDQYMQHTIEHFSNEEGLMQLHGFPAYPVHKGEHQQQLQKIEQLAQSWHQDRNIEPFAAYLENGLLTWLNSHILTMDTMTAYFIARQTDDR
jgi:hemerythrin